MADKKIQWHPGFAAAINLELSANRKDLVYEREYNLNTKPLEVDLLVIKKERAVQVENEIGRLFRGHNILEYKSPDDSLNIDTFYKAAAYACLYKAYGEAVDARQADDITVSIIRERKPDGLFQYFENHGIRTVQPYAGIYYVLDAVQFPTQLIVTKELDMENHTWLKSLSNRLEKQEIRRLLECVEKLTQEVEKQLADAVLEVSIQANQKIVEELRGDEGMCQALLEIMEPEINQIVEAATKKSKQEAEKSKQEAEKSKQEAEKSKQEAEKSKQEAEKSKQEAEKSKQETEKLKKEAKEEAIQTATKILESGKLSVEEIRNCVPRLSIKEIEAIAKGLN